MKISDDLNKKELFLIDANGIQLKVARVGKSPRIRTPKHYKFPSDPIAKVHTHSTYEIFFVTDGSLKLVTDNNIYDFEKSVLIVPPKAKHISIPISGDSFCLLFSFANKIDEQTFSKTFSTTSILEIPIDDDIIFYIKKINEITENSGDDNEVYHLLSLAFNYIFKKIQSKHKKANEKAKKSINHIGIIEEFINKNIKNKLTLKTLSDNVFLSEKQVSRIIKKEYNCSFTELLAEKRLAVACALLKNTDLKVSDIASQTFYGNEAYFYTTFKKKYNMSPLKYRKNM